MTVDIDKLCPELAKIIKELKELRREYEKNPSTLSYRVTPGQFDAIKDCFLALAEERQFLLHRANEGGHCNLTEDRFTGTSSNALVRFAFGGERPEDGEFPRDGGDLDACRRTMEMLPEHLKTDEVRRLFDEYTRFRC